MGLRPTRANEHQRRPRESGDPLPVQGIPAFAGMTRFSGEPQATKDLRSLLKVQLPGFFASLRMTVFQGFSTICQVLSTTSDCRLPDPGWRFPTHASPPSAGAAFPAGSP